MADISKTATQVSLMDPIKAVVGTYIAAVAITKGQAVYFTTAGKVGIADANDSGKEQFRGIALGDAMAGHAVDVLHEGEVAGFDVSGMNGDAMVYLSNTAGELADAAGTMTVVAGRVVTLPNTPTLTKCIRIFTQWEADWS